MRRELGSITPHKGQKNVWLVRVTLANGKRKSKVVRGNKKQAAEELNKLLALAGHTQGDITFQDFCRLKEYYRGQEVLVTTQAKIKFEIVLEDAKCDEVVDLIINTARTGEIGDGKVFVYNVEEAIRIRTNGRGADAL